MEKEECYNLYDKEREFLELLEKNKIHYDPILGDIYYGIKENEIRIGSILSCQTSFLLIASIPKGANAKKKSELERGVSKLQKLAQEFKVN